MLFLRAELLTLYERVILTDIEFSDSQNLDQALWKNVFYQVIERFRQLLKDQASDTAPQIKTMLMNVLEEVRMHKIVYSLFSHIFVYCCRCFSSNQLSKVLLYIHTVHYIFMLYYVFSTLALPLVFMQVNDELGNYVMFIFFL